MKLKRLFAAGLAATFLAATVPAAARADGENDARRYAKREAECPELEGYSGGCPGPDGPLLVLIVVTLPITLPVAGVYYLVKTAVEGIGSLFSSDETPPPTEPEPPPAPADKKKEKKCRPRYDRLTRTPSVVGAAA